MATPRFYLPASLDSATAELDGPEAHHLCNVLRLQPGDEVILFDGAGLEAIARVETAKKKRATLTILSRGESEAELPVPLTLATAVPKGERFRWLVEKATELGATQLVPLRTELSVVDPRAAKLDKMRAAVVAASKQCGRAKLMEIAPPQRWEELLASHPDDAQLLIAHPGGSPWRPEMLTADRPVVVGVGPEGGFSDAEIDGARAQATLIDLGPRILRIETAALALVTLAATALVR